MLPREPEDTPRLHALGIGRALRQGWVAVMRRTRSAAPLLVVTYRAPSAPKRTLRRRPYALSKRMFVWRAVPANSSKRRRSVSFSVATKSEPLHAPHCGPTTKSPPDVASVTLPDDHTGSM